MAVPVRRELDARAAVLFGLESIAIGNRIQGLDRNMRAAGILTPEMSRERTNKIRERDME